MKKFIEFDASNPVKNEIFVRVKDEVVKSLSRLECIKGRNIKLTAHGHNTSRVVEGEIMIKGVGKFPPDYFYQVIDDDTPEEPFEARFNREMREKRKLDLSTSVNFVQLLREKGGDWLGRAREWIQCKAMNGEQVTWGSQDYLKLKPLTVQDIELLASEIAAAAINEHNKNVLSCGVKGFEKEQHIKPSIADKLFPAYVNAINKLDDYFEYRHESARDKAFVMGVIDNLTRQLKEIQDAKI